MTTMNLLLVAAATALFFGVEIHSASVRSEMPECHDFGEFQHKWWQCKNRSDDALIFEDPLGFAQDTCREKETKLQCMREAFATCDNIDVAVNAARDTFAYCTGTQVDNVFAYYLEHSYTPLSRTCQLETKRAIQECIEPTFMDIVFQSPAIDKGLQNYYDLYTVMVDCFGPFMERPSVPECGMESGRKVARDYLATLTLKNVAGSASYERFVPLLLPQ